LRRGFSALSKDKQYEVHVGASSPKGIAKLEEKPSDLDFVIENMRQGLWRLNSIGVITYANPYLAEWLESTPDAMIGQHFSRFRNLGLVAAAPCEPSLSQRYEAEYKTKTGIIRHAIVVTSPAIDESGELTGTVDLITDITAEHAVQAKLVQEVQKMSHLATTDSLTGVHNRYVFEQTLRAMTSLADEEPFGLVIVDLDGFKEINDDHGHKWGDRVLESVAERLMGAVRDHDVVSRFGGDEFTVLLPNANKTSVAEVVQRLKKRLQYKIPGNGGPIKVSVSIGWSHSDDDLCGMVHAADQEMYRRKNARKAKTA
jgi:diguanylate cyclase (GGDEF)-like protein